MALVGYARTSTVDQVAGLEDQLAALRSAGVERCFSEHVSALAERRPAWEACRAWLRDGDTLVVTRPDRLARSIPDLLSIAKELASQGVGLRVLSIGGLELDTGKPADKLLLTILGAVAAWEREIMLERQRVGIAKAKADGKYKGRAPVGRRAAAEIVRLSGEGRSGPEVAKLTDVSLSSVRRALREARARG